jgi:hypothetical protein
MALRLLRQLVTAPADQYSPAMSSQFKSTDLPVP